MSAHLTAFVFNWLQAPPRGFLTAEQEASLDAIFARILPGDKERCVPSAVDAGASRFVSLLLARDPSVCVEIVDWRELYPVSLKALDAYCRRTYGALLTKISDEQMDALLEGLEKGAMQGLEKEINQTLLWKTLYRHCIQGCFADPRWGGNRDKIMWRWFGYLQQAEDVL